MGFFIFFFAQASELVSYQVNWGHVAVGVVADEEAVSVQQAEKSCTFEQSMHKCFLVNRKSKMRIKISLKVFSSLFWDKKLVKMLYGKT